MDLFCTISDFFFLKSQQRYYFSRNYTKKSGFLFGGFGYYLHLCTQIFVKTMIFQLNIQPRCAYYRCI